MSTFSLFYLHNIPRTSYQFYYFENGKREWLWNEVVSYLCIYHIYVCIHFCLNGNFQSVVCWSAAELSSSGRVRGLICTDESGNESSRIMIRLVNAIFILPPCVSLGLLEVHIYTLQRGFDRLIRTGDQRLRVSDFVETNDTMSVLSAPVRQTPSQWHQSWP